MWWKGGGGRFPLCLLDDDDNQVCFWPSCCDAIISSLLLIFCVLLLKAKAESLCGGHMWSFVRRHQWLLNTLFFSFISLSTVDSDTGLMCVFFCRSSLFSRCMAASPPALNRFKKKSTNGDTVHVRSPVPPSGQSGRDSQLEVCLNL